MAYRIGIPNQYIDLYVRFVDAAGNPANTDDTPTVTIYDSEGSLKRSSSSSGVGLIDDGEAGLYHLSWEIPANSIDGYYTDTWTAEIGNTSVSNTFSFRVISSGTITQVDEPVFEPGDDVEWDFTQDESYGINILLKLLKPRLKNDGTRKIRDGNTYTEVACSIFTDDELIAFLVNSLSEFNQFPHFTNYNFNDPQIYGIFADIIVQGAALLAMAAQALIERGREFNITDNGVTFAAPAVSEILNAQYTTQLADYKDKLKNIKYSLKPGPISLGTFRCSAMAPAYLRLRHLRQRQII